jgi:tRNA(fMet)-specific endonuclease VapC
MSEHLKGKNSIVVRRAAAYLSRHKRTTFSLITQFEVLRGLKARNATRLLTQFEAICQRDEILLITEDIIVLAADLWADLKRRGQLIGDSDVIIAATALHDCLPLATGNVAHFGRIPGLIIEDWTKP